MASRGRRRISPTRCAATSPETIHVGCGAGHSGGPPPLRRAARAAGRAPAAQGPARPHGARPAEPRDFDFDGTLDAPEARSFDPGRSPRLRLEVGFGGGEHLAHEAGRCPRGAGSSAASPSSTASPSWWSASRRSSSTTSGMHAERRGRVARCAAPGLPRRGRRLLSRPVAQAPPAQAALPVRGQSRPPGAGAEAGRAAALRHRHRRLRRLGAGARAAVGGLRLGGARRPTTGAIPGTAGHRRATSRRPFARDARQLISPSSDDRCIAHRYGP